MATLERHELTEVLPVMVRSSGEIARHHGVSIVGNLV